MPSLHWADAFVTPTAISTEHEEEVIESILDAAKGLLVYPTPFADWEGQDMIATHILGDESKAALARSSFTTALDRSNRAWEAMSEGVDTYLCDNSKVGPRLMTLEINIY